MSGPQHRRLSLGLCSELLGPSRWRREGSPLFPFISEHRSKFSAPSEQETPPRKQPWGQDLSPGTPPTPREDTSSAGPFLANVGLSSAVTTGGPSSAPRWALLLPQQAHKYTRTPGSLSTRLLRPTDSLHLPRGLREAVSTSSSVATRVWVHLKSTAPGWDNPRLHAGLKHSASPHTPFSPFPQLANPSSHCLPV